MVEVDPLSDWWVHPITIERLVGEGGAGKVYGSLEVVFGFYDDYSKRVVTGTGVELISSARVMLPTRYWDDEGVEHEVANIPPGSRVTSPIAFGNRVHEVVEFGRHEASEMPVPDHLEVVLL